VVTTPHSAHGLQIPIDARLDPPEDDREYGYHEAQCAYRGTPRMQAATQPTYPEINILGH
jgi:hypothetical protein